MISARQNTDQWEDRFEKFNVPGHESDALKFGVDLGDSRLGSVDSVIEHRPEYLDAGSRDVEAVLL